MSTLSSVLPDKGLGRVYAFNEGGSIRFYSLAGAIQNDTSIEKK